MESPNTQEIKKNEIIFPNGNKARLVETSLEENPREILKTLAISPPQAALIIIGNAGTEFEQRTQTRLSQLISRGVARAAEESDAVIIDGGTAVGVMAMDGEAVAGLDKKVNLIGVCPADLVFYPGIAKDNKTALDPNHTHFVLTRSNVWGSEMRTLFSLAEALSTSASPVAPLPGEIPASGQPVSPPKAVLTVLAGGGEIALEEALTTVRKGWPLVVIEGTGRSADQIAQLFRISNEKRRLRRWFRRAEKSLHPSLRAKSPAEEAKLLEILEDGKILLFPVRGKPASLRELLYKELQKTADSVLEQAWQRFALFDKNAARHQKVYKLLKTWPLILGVVSTAIILIQTYLLKFPEINWKGNWGYEILRVFIILVPIVISIFLAADRLLKSGNKWILLRYGAERIKRDIYSYRILSSLTPTDNEDLPQNQGDLAGDISNLARRLMRTDVNEAALVPYRGDIPPSMYGTGANDDGFSKMTADKYIKIRINDQLNFFRLKTNALERVLRPRQWLILIFGAVGALLAALGQEFWLPLTAAIVSALTAYLEYQQVEQSLVKYNQAMTNLNNHLFWWYALSAEEKGSPDNILRLVEDTETVLDTENAGWVQQMQDILARDTDQTPQPNGKTGSDQSDASKATPQTAAGVNKPQDVLAIIQPDPGIQPNAEHTADNG